MNYDEDGNAIFSVTVDDFYDTLTKKLDICEETGKKFFYFEDSMDALTSEADIKKNYENQRYSPQVYFHEETVTYSYERRKVPLVTITSYNNIESFA